MTTASRKQHFELGILGPFVVGVHGRRDPRVVECVHQERGRLDLAEELPRVILVVVVRGIGEAVSRRDDFLVEVEDGSNALKQARFL